MYNIQKILALFIFLLFIFSTVSVQTEAENPEPDDYPNGWPHRPIMEQFTSLG